MIISNLGDNYSSNMVKAKVELYDGSTLVTTCTCSDVLSEFKISRIGEQGKFFGFGICHTLNMTLIDLDKVLRIYEGYTAKVCLGNGTIFDCPYPELEITNVSVDKKSGDIKITAYDPLNRASELSFTDLGIESPYYVTDIAAACAAQLGVSLGALDSSFDLLLSEPANYNEDDTIRTVLNHIAEATQTIYFIDYYNQLVFKRLSPVIVEEYGENKYYEFETSEPKVLKGICNATSLGDNLLQENPEITSGVIQYIRDNGIWDIRTDVATLLEEAVDRISGLELYQYSLDWSGDYRLEIGDCISIVSDNDVTHVFVLNDIITYDGTLSEETSWQYKDSDADTFANPTNIGDKINQTYARVDKVNKEITLVASETRSNSANIAQIQLDTDSITASVIQERQVRETAVNELNDAITTVNTQVSNIVLESDRALLEFKEQIAADGVTKVDTGTGFTFDASGMTVETNTSDVKTQVSDNGMNISKKSTEEILLSVNDSGVKAEDLHATTYLMIGNNSRFENYKTTRTGCFWIGN